MSVTINGRRMELMRGDITAQTTDAIVNAANSELKGGGGVDGAIHRAGGPSIMEACRKIGRCPTGEAVATPGGNLKARYVIHAVGPIYRGSVEEARLLSDAYRNSLRRAEELKMESIAFPSISTGAYGYPVAAASAIALTTAWRFLKEEAQSLKLIRFVLFSDKDLKSYERTLSEEILSRNPAAS